MSESPTIDPALQGADAANPARFIRMAFEGQDLAPLISDRLDRLGEAEDSSVDLLELGLLFQLVNQRDKALACQQAALATRRLYRHGEAPAPALRVLAISTLGDLMTNTPFELLLEGRNVEISKLYVDAERPWVSVAPEHDLAIMTVSESDLARPLLERLQAIEASWPRPLINRPSRVLELGRDRLFHVLSDVPGLVIPPTVRIPRDELYQAVSARAQGVELPPTQFPMIVRPVDSHAGIGLGKVDDWDELQAYLETAPSGLLYLSPFVDYRSSDGLYRKLRIAFFGGRPFLCHMAVSEHWMVHYLNAGMAESEAKRAEEQAAMETFEQGFASRHAEAFRGLQQRLGLEYFAIDCAELRDGSLLIFEADVAMIIHDLDPPELYPYKKRQMKAVFDAFEAYLKSIPEAPR
jgi:hypothetical protein